jgi:plasmid maintenance system antidote protein VapI
MNFQDLHEEVRAAVQRRIDRGYLTGTMLARQAGFQQAHISNFLNKKRALSMDALDRVLAAQGMSVDELLPLDLSASAAVAADSIAAIPVVSPTTAMEEPTVRPGLVIETVPVAAERLEEMRSRVSAKGAEWQRFVAVRADAQQAAAMEPMIGAGAVVVVDRHYRSLAPYRAQQKTLYAVRAGAALALRYVEFDDGRLILRPLAAAFPVQLLALGAEETPGDYLVGRVCLVVAEV